MHELTLAFTANVGPKRLQKMLDHGEINEAAIRHVLGEDIAAAYRKALEQNLAQNMQDQAQKHGAQIVGMWQPEYPQRLLHLVAPPHVLYLKGEFCATKTIGVVGTRKSSPWANAWTKSICKALAQAGVGVVSGLAKGIDTESHKGALEGEGYTMGVLGSALDKIYPKENVQLSSQMHLLTEVPFGVPSRADFFPRRNRIIAGLVDAVLVVEAGQSSGALITAKHAMELGRDVLAVPGRPTDANAQGCNRLIKDGAGLVQSAEDILFALGVTAPKTPQHVLGDVETVVYKVLRDRGECLPETIAQEAEMGLIEVLALLALLEVKGVVQSLANGRYLAI